MVDIKGILENNRSWSAQIKAADPGFFERLSHQQAPDYLWIGCSDSRVPATQLVGLSPGMIFVHRNVANIVVHTDLNCMSVIQYAVEVLKVKHIIVCGHYGCGGVQAALLNSQLGLIDNWLRHVQSVAQKHQALLDASDGDTQRLRKLCELNVIEQALNVCQTTIMQQAWERGQETTVHGWVYGLDNGLLHNLDMHAASKEAALVSYHAAVAAAAKRQESTAASQK